MFTSKTPPLNISWTTVTEPALAASPAADQLQKLEKLRYLVTSFLLLSFSLIWSAHTVSLVCCGHPHKSFCQFRHTTWTLLLVVSQLLLRDFGTLFHWTVELLHPLTHLRSVSRHFSLIQHNPTVARASVLWRDINWLIDWLIKRRCTSGPVQLADRWTESGGCKCADLVTLLPRDVDTEPGSALRRSAGVEVRSI